MKRTARLNLSSVKLASFFVAFVSIVLVLAISIRVVHTVQKSIFDAQHQFILLIVTSDHSALLTLFVPSRHTTDVVPLQFKPGEGINEKLHLGVDDTVQAGLQTSDVQKALTASIFFSQKSKVTWYDILQFLWIAHTGTATYEKPVNISSSSDIDLQKISALFLDPDIEHENKAIQIINASAISGVGKKEEQVVTNMGGNVIDIRTAAQPQMKSVILYYDTISYTALKIQRELGFPLQQTQTKSIAQIQIIIGKDKQ